MVLRNTESQERSAERFLAGLRARLGLPSGSEHSECIFGAPTSKPTSLKLRGDLRALWKVLWSGESYSSPQPRLRGTQWAIPYEQWSPDVKRRSEPYGDFITRGAAAYPRGLNEFLAMELIRAANVARAKVHRQHVTEDHAKDAAAYIRTGRFGNVLIRKELAVERTDTVDPQLRFMHRLTAHRPDANKEDQNAKAIGGLRDAFATLGKVPGLRIAGEKLRAFFEHQLDNDAKLEADILHALNKQVDLGFEVEDVRLQKLREQLGVLLQVHDVGPEHET